MKKFEYVIKNFHSCLLPFATADFRSLQLPEKWGSYKIW